ncbi:hypothetical protein GCM10009734_36350 [Nonomuraea bangladeshensis]
MVQNVRSAVQTAKRRGPHGGEVSGCISKRVSSPVTARVALWVPRGLPVRSGWHWYGEPSGWVSGADLTVHARPVRASSSRSSSASAPVQNSWRKIASVSGQQGGDEDMSDHRGKFQHM